MNPQKKIASLIKIIKSFTFYIYQHKLLFAIKISKLMFINQIYNEHLKFKN